MTPEPRRFEPGRGRHNTLRVSLKILYRLSEGRGRTWYELAEETGVTTRTVRRHIAALQDAGFLVDVFTGYDRDAKAVVSLVNPGFASRTLKKRVAV